MGTNEVYCRGPGQNRKIKEEFLDEVTFETEESWQRECFHVKVPKLLEKLKVDSYIVYDYSHHGNVIKIGKKDGGQAGRAKHARPSFEF